MILTKTSCIPPYKKQGLLLIMALLCYTSIFSQGFYQTYPEATPSIGDRVRATNNGFTIDTKQFVFGDPNGFVNTDDQGALVDSDIYTFQNGDPDLQLNNGNFLRAEVDNDAAMVNYEIINPDETVDRTISLSFPAGKFAGLGGSANFSDGNLFLSFYYGDSIDDPFDLEKRTIFYAKVNPNTGATIWQNSFESDRNIFVARPYLVTPAADGSVFFAIVEEVPLNQVHFVTKIAANGQLVWRQQVATLERGPRELAPSSDGGVWFTFSQVFSFINKINADGTGASTGAVDQVLQSGGYTRDAIVGTDDGGVLLAGRISSSALFDITEETMFTIRFDAQGTNPQVNILPDVQPVPQLRKGLRVDDGFVLSGFYDPNDQVFNDQYPLLIKLNENGDYIPGGNQGVDVQLSIATNNPTPDQYDYFEVTLTATNVGNTPATGLRVDFSKEAQVVYSGGNEYQASQGSFSPHGNQVWNVGTLAGGSTTTLKVTYFVLDDSPFIAYAQVIGMNEDDVDSTPNNGTPPTTNEDDESSVGINGGGLVPCSFDVIVDQIFCADRGTEDPSDDTYSVRFFVTSTGECSQYYRVDGGATLNVYNGVGSSAFGGLISTGGKTFVISDFEDPSIRQEIFVAAPQSCSGSVSAIDLELELEQSVNNPSQFSNYSVTATITNRGGEAATGIKVAFARPDGVVYRGSDPYNLSSGTFNPFGSQVWEINLLPAGNIATLTVNYFLREDAAPIAYAQVTAANQNDGDSTPNNGTPPTPNEDDEAATGDGPIGGDRPDLDLADLKNLSSPVDAGAVLNYTVDIKNIGTADIPGSFSVKAYISTDNNLSNDDIQDGTINTGNFSAGYTANDVAAASTIPANLSAGDYYLILKVDADNQVTESNEGNNTISRAFTVNGDTGGGCNVSAIGGLGSLAISGLNTSIKIIKIYDPSFSLIYECNTFQGDNCSNSITRTGLAGGSYYVDVQLFDSNGLTCKFDEFVDVASARASNEINNTMQIGVYPNPAHQEVFVQLRTSEAQQVQVEMYNSFGVLVRQQKIENGNSLRFDVSELNAGIYFISVKAADRKVISKRVAIQRL